MESSNNNDNYYILLVEDENIFLICLLNIYHPVDSIQSHFKIRLMH